MADQPLAQLQVREARVVAVPDGELLLEQSAALVEQEDAEGAIRHDLVHQRGDALEQLLEIEDRGHLPADLRQRLERLDVRLLPLEEPRVLDGHRDVRAELAQHRLVARRELPDVLAVQVERPDDPFLAPQRHGNLRPHVGHRPDVPRVGQHVVDHQRPAFGHHGAHDALADRQPERPLDIVGVADGVGDAQILALLVEQPHGKGLEGRQARDELGNLLEQLVEVENRGDLATQLEQGDEQLGGIARLGGIWSSRRWRI